MKLLLRILICSLLLSQFAMAVHAYEHVAPDNEAEECVFCLKQASSKVDLPETDDFYHPVSVAGERSQASFEQPLKCDIQLPVGRGPPHS